MALVLEATGAALSRLIDPAQDARTLANAADGLIFTEGPIWNRAAGEWTFSDIAGNAMYRVSPRGGLTRLVDYSFKANGNAYTPGGDIVTCEHATSRVVRRDNAGGDYRVLVSHYMGRELNSPNDVVVRRNGDIYFTDPYFGRNPSRVGVARARALSFCGVYRLAGDALTLLDDRCETPNGLCFSQGEGRLFVADSKPSEILVYDVGADGMLQNRRVFAKTQGEGPGLPDGLKLDAAGHLYCCAQGGIHVFAADGAALGRVVFPFQVANFAFGGADGRTMLICAGDRVFTIRSEIPGLAAG